MKNLITENTGISLGILGAIVGAVMWVTFIAAKVEANAKTLNDLDAKLTTMLAIQSDVSVIRWKVESIERQLADRRGK